LPGIAAHREQGEYKMTDQIHSCSYYCLLPSCVKAQRDELRDKFVAIPDTHRVVSVETLEHLYSSAYYDEDEALIRAIIDNKEQK